MYCPQCGQQQAAGAVRYCSRCGFLLEGVSVVMASGGILPAHPVPPVNRALSPRSKGVRQGAMLMLTTVLAVPLIAIITAGVLDFGQELIPLTAVFCFLGGLLRILYAVIMQSEEPEVARNPSALYPTQPGHLHRSPENPALPPASVNTAPWRSRPNTAEIYQPPSVTENTTRLLDKDERNSR